MKLLHAAALAIAPVLAVSGSPAIANGETAAKLSINSPIEALMANAAAKALVVKHLGPLDQHPAYGQFKGMTLVQLKPMSGGQISEAALEKIKAGLASL